MAEPRRAGPLAALSVLGAGAGWGVPTGAVAGAVAAFLSASDPRSGDIPGAVALGLFFGIPTGLVLGLALSLLPAVLTSLVRSPRQARLAAAVAYLPLAALVLVSPFAGVTSAPIGYAALYAGALLFGLWRCQRSADCAVERVARRRAAPPVMRPGVPLEEPASG